MITNQQHLEPNPSPIKQIRIKPLQLNQAKSNLDPKLEATKVPKKDDELYSSFSSN